MKSLADMLREGARLNPDGIAVQEYGGDGISYRELDALADRIAGSLSARGVEAGDRVAIWLDKSIGAVAAMQAALRLGAAYVPIDPSGPAGRASKLLADSRPAVCVTSADRAAADTAGPSPLVLGSDAEPVESDRAGRSPSFKPANLSPGRLAYILYTSGSTGSPKGVCISHRNAMAFIEWAHAELAPKPSDRFANHAPLHFDLSVLDIYVAFHSGATVVLVPDSLTFAARRLVELVRSERITVWYSVPSVLTLMIEQGGLLDSPRSLLAVLFAGEVFPIKYVRKLREAFPDVRLLNLFGPTETNVCTYEEVFEVPADRTRPVPIGRPCSGARVWVEDDDGLPVETGGKGELVVDGPTVMQGYWGAPPRSGPYRTGDVVRQIAADRYEYVGRRDSMVKVRGNRVDLGEVEWAVAAHPDVEEAAVIADGAGMDIRLIAFVTTTGSAPPSLLEVKRHCAEHVPRYMVIHSLRPLDSLPRSSTGKVDRQALVAKSREELLRT